MRPVMSVVVVEVRRTGVDLSHTDQSQSQSFAPGDEPEELAVVGDGANEYRVARICIGPVGRKRLQEVSTEPPGDPNLVDVGQSVSSRCSAFSASVLHDTGSASSRPGEIVE